MSGLCKLCQARPVTAVTDLLCDRCAAVVRLSPPPPGVTDYWGEPPPQRRRSPWLAFWSHPASWVSVCLIVFLAILRLMLFLAGAFR